MQYSNHRLRLLSFLVVLMVATGLSGCGLDQAVDVISTNKPGSVAAPTEKGTVNESTEKETLDEIDAIEAEIDSFCEKFNGISDTKLVYCEAFSVQDSSSGHYRVEFRLDTYNMSVGKSYSYNDKTIDLVARKKSLFGKGIPVRLYSDNITYSEGLDIIASAAPIFDPQLTDKEIGEIVDYIQEHREANGYYKGDLCVVFLGSEEKGYQLMMRKDNE